MTLDQDNDLFNGLPPFVSGELLPSAILVPPIIVDDAAIPSEAQTCDSWAKVETAAMQPVVNLAPMQRLASVESSETATRLRTRLKDIRDSNTVVVAWGRKRKTEEWDAEVEPAIKRNRAVANGTSLNVFGSNGNNDLLASVCLYLRIYSRCHTLQNLLKFYTHCKTS